MTGAVRVEITDAVAVITVDNPPVNALADPVLAALGDVATSLAEDGEVRAIVLASTGDRAFMAGADLDGFQRLLADDGSIEEHMAISRRAFDQLAALPQPLVAAVQAAAMGGGLEAALTCDLIVADPGARLGFPEVRLGLMPGAGGTQRLPLRIGAGPARELLLLGRAVDAAEAQRLGLVNRVSAPGAALEEALALAGRLAALPGLAVASIKQVLTSDPSPGLDRERAAFLELFHSPDAREGVAAFVEKRPPVFTHRP